MNEEFSCSSSWNGHKAQEKRFYRIPYVTRNTGLSFRQVELNYNVTEQTLREMYPLLETGNMKVSSLHNVFPKAPSEYGPSSVFLGFEDDHKRKKSHRLYHKNN